MSQYGVLILRPKEGCCTVLRMLNRWPLLPSLVQLLLKNSAEKNGDVPDKSPYTHDYSAFSREGGGAIYAGSLCKYVYLVSSPWYLAGVGASLSSTTSPPPEATGCKHDLSVGSG